MLPIMEGIARLAAQMLGSQVFDFAYYRESELARLMNLFAHVDLEKWRGLRILEVGAGTGHLGEAFVNMGFDVTSTDGRPEYVEQMRSKGRRAFVLDLDNIEAHQVEGYDIILSFGVLYHLTNPEWHLHSCRKARVLVLETLVCDSDEPVVQPIRERKGLLGRDQALNEFGCRPSPVWIESKVREAGFTTIRDISNPNANWVKGKFDWQPTSSGVWKVGAVNYRKMWVCER